MEMQQLIKVTKEDRSQASSEVDGMRILYLPYHPGFICVHEVRAWRLAPLPRAVCCIEEVPTAVEKMDCSDETELIRIKCSRLLAKWMGKLMGDKKNGCQVILILKEIPAGKIRLCVFVTNNGWWRSHEKQISCCLQTFPIMSELCGYLQDNVLINVSSFLGG